MAGLLRTDPQTAKLTTTTSNIRPIQGPALASTTRLDDSFRLKRSLHHLFSKNTIPASQPASIYFCVRSHSESPMVGLGGLEPPTSPLSGARSNHLSYRPMGLLRAAFPEESAHGWAGLCEWTRFKLSGGACRDRTDDPLLAKQVLSQLS
jgi:hypothetical protein